LASKIKQRRMKLSDANQIQTTKIKRYDSS